MYAYEAFQENLSILPETLFNGQGALTGDTKVLSLLPGSPRAGWIGLRYEFGGDEPKKD